MDWAGVWLPRRLLGFAVMLCALGVALAALAGGFAFDVRISQDQLNRTATAKLPLERKAGPVVWRIETATLTVRDRGRIAVDARVHAAIAAHEADAHLAGSGVLAYRDAAFWLSDIDIDALDDIVLRNTGDPESRPSALGKALKSALAGIKDEAISEALKHAEPALDATFRTIPVYRLRDDWKGAAARWVLVSVRTEGGDLVATLDPVSETLRLAAAAVILLILFYDLLCLVAGLTSLLGGFGDWLLFWW